MKRITLIFILISSALFANSQNSMDHSKMNHTTTAKSGMAYHNEMATRDGFSVSIHSKKTFVNGNNEVEIMILNGGKIVQNADVKIKFFMPEMPGTPYMEYEDKGKLTNGVFKANINLSMNGTWQYQIRFRTEDTKIRMVKGSINY